MISPFSYKEIRDFIDGPYCEVNTPTGKAHLSYGKLTEEHSKNHLVSLEKTIGGESFDSLIKNSKLPARQVGELENQLREKYISYTKGNVTISVAERIDPDKLALDLERLVSNPNVPSINHIDKESFKVALSQRSLNQATVDLTITDVLKGKTAAKALFQAYSSPEHTRSPQALVKKQIEREVYEKNLSVATKARELKERRKEILVKTFSHHQKEKLLGWRTKSIFRALPLYYERRKLRIEQSKLEREERQHQRQMKKLDQSLLKRDALEKTRKLALKNLANQKDIEQVKQVPQKELKKMMKKEIARQKSKNHSNDIEIG